MIFSKSNIAKYLVIALICIFLVGGCATSPRSTYVAMERQFEALAQQYDIHYNAGAIDEKTHDRAMLLFKSADKTLDLYKVAILAGEPTDNLYMDLNRLKTQIVFELSKM